MYFLKVEPTMNPAYLILSYLSTKRTHVVKATCEKASCAPKAPEDGGALATFEVPLSGLIFIKIKNPTSRAFVLSLVYVKM